MGADEERIRRAERIRQEIAGAVVRRNPDASSPPAAPPPDEKAESPRETTSSTSARWFSLHTTHPLAIPAVVAITVVMTLLAVYAGVKLIGSKDGPVPATKSPATPEQQRAMREALTALQSLQSVTSVGVTYAEYMRRLGDAKIKVDQVSEQIKNPEIQAAIERAMSYYGVTGSVWNAKIQRNDVSGYLRIYASECQLLSDLITRSNRDKYPDITLESEGVSTMMTCAARKVTEASELINLPRAVVR